MTFERYLINKKNTIENLHNRKTDVKMTLMKAFGIIAVVAGHTNGGAIVFPMANWVMPYFYYMPLFVFVSGYLYKPEYDKSSIAFFIKKKLKALVLPYYVWNVIYGVIVSFFRNEQIVNYGEAISFETLIISPWIDSQQFVFNIPAWFLLSLFLDTVIIFLLRKVLKDILYKDITILVLTYLISILCKARV